MNNMIKTDNKDMCSGCTACKSICPTHCIEMIPDKEGFLYPSIDETKCIHCNKCEHVCPVSNKKQLTSAKIRSFVFQSNYDRHLSKCTSGGAFTEIAYHFVLKDWYISGAIYDKKFKVKHIISNDIDDIIAFAGSKYVQSDLNDVFDSVRCLLDRGQKILFCGTPCQVEGLKQLVGDDENLYTVDLVCHGVSSPLIWEKYLEHTQKLRGTLKSVNFRSKKYGYHIPVMEEEYLGGRKYYASARTHIMSKIYFRNIADRPICYKCPFKTKYRVSDLTLYDCWHVSDLTKRFKDNDKGYTNVIVHTPKGEVLIEALRKHERIVEVNTDKAIKLDGKMMLAPVKENILRKEFYDVFTSEGLLPAVNKYLTISWKDRLIEKKKDALDKTGLLYLMIKVKK